MAPPFPPLPRRLTDHAELADLSRSRTTDEVPLTKGTMQKLSNALNHLKTKDAPAGATLTSLLSPCYLHRRFDDAVDIEKVLEEIAGDEAMSHSRLVQTATGVREISRQLQRRPIKRASRNVMIVTKARDNELVSLTRELAEWLLSTPRYGSNMGVNVYVDEKLRHSKRFGASELVAKESRYDRMLRYWTPDLCWKTPEKFDLVLTLGGDGTVLYTAWLFQRIVPPILSFSLGSLGFLTPFQFQHYREDLNKVMGGAAGAGSGASNTPLPGSAGELLKQAGFNSYEPTGASSPTFTSSEVVPDAGMRVNLRMRFTCTVHRAPRRKASSSIASSSKRSSTSNLTPTSTPDGESTTSSSAAQAEPTTQFEVLNEVVIDRGPSPYVSNLELFGDDNLLTVIQADGCIFSTPTGSTAYSLSAGGSLCDPSIPAILLTPICPHTLSFRPMLLNDTISLRVAVPRGSRAGAWCSFDGKGRIELRPGDYVSIRASRYPFASVVGQKGESWIDSVSRTLRWNTREARQKNWSSGVPGRRNRVGSVESMAHHLATQPPIDEHGEEDGDVDGQLEDEAEAEEHGDEQDEDFDIDFDDEEAATARPTGTDSGYGGDTPAPSTPGSGSLPSTSKRLDRLSELSL